ncbi:hypothetical protein KJ673_03380 [Patescibacteria group bacterium]|nr:hypothetical protein [Patescibacteria group bacterium]MCG2687877.1 hypothetical protein [Candidatus Parcubacteria bacterium]
MGVCVACSSAVDDELMQDDLCPNCLGEEIVKGDEGEMDDDSMNDVVGETDDDDDLLSEE